MKKFFAAVTSFLLPTMAFAAFSDIGGLINYADALIRVFIPILIGLGVVVLLWGIVKFIMGAGDEDKRSEGRQLMIWGIIGIFVMVSIWGLVNFLIASFITNAATPAFPSAPGSPNPVP